MAGARDQQKVLNHGESVELPHQHKEKINIAFVGLESSGKSRLINAVLELDSRNPLAAKVSLDSTLSQPARYNVPNDTKRLLWELPPVICITPDYLADVQFELYDAVVLCCSTILSDYDLAWAKACQKEGTPCIVVRTKIDLDIESDKEDYGEEHDEVKQLGLIKAEIQDQLNDGDITYKVYVMSCQHPDMWEFKMVKGLILDFQKHTKVVRVNTEDVEVGDDITMKTKLGIRTQIHQRDVLEQTKENFVNDIDRVLWEAAKLGNVRGVDDMIERCKQLFGVPNVELNDINTHMMRNKVDSVGKHDETLKCSLSNPSKYFSQDKLDLVKTEKSAIIMTDGGAIVWKAIDKCYSAALENLQKEQ